MASPVQSALSEFYHVLETERAQWGFSMGKTWQLLTRWTCHAVILGEYLREQQYTTAMVSTSRFVEKEGTFKNLLQKGFRKGEGSKQRKRLAIEAWGRYIDELYVESLKQQ